MSGDGPNVVLVTIDSLRADHCGFMGYERDTTPTLDRMATDGLAYRNAIAPGPATPESMPVVFTGNFPIDRSVETGDSAGLERRRERIRAHMETRDTLPQKFQRLGYQTAAFTPNPYTSRHFGFDQGFDRFQDFMDESNRGSLYQRVFDGFLDGSEISSIARVLLNVWQREEVFKPWESYYDEVLEWTRQTDAPYFLWVFLMDAHNPYMASSTYRTQSRFREFHANFAFWRQSHETPFSDAIHEKLVTAYDDAIRYSDAFLDRLQADLADGTVIAVHGDHGEAFGEHGTYGHEPSLYRENTHVPLVVSGVGDAEYREPFSLAALPELLVSLTQGENGTHGTGDYAVSATRQGSRTAVHTAGPDYIASKDGGEVTGANGLGEPQLERFRGVASRVLDEWHRSRTEQRAIGKSARAVAREEHV